MFSCWNNRDNNIRLEVANHNNFTTTLEQIKIGLSNSELKVSEVYSLRKEEKKNLAISLKINKILLKYLILKSE